MKAGRIETGSREDGVEVVTMSGEHDLSTAEELRETLRTARAGGAVVVDMSRVGFIDSSIVAVLVECGKPDGDSNTGGGGATVAIHIPPEASPSVRRVIDLTGLEAHMLFTETLDEAIEAVTGTD